MWPNAGGPWHSLSKRFARKPRGGKGRRRVGQGIQNDQPLWISSPSETSVTLSEAEAKAALSHTGLTVPAARVVSLDDIDNQVDFPFPAVLKAQGLAHKSDAGGVALNLTSLDVVKSAAQNMGRDSFLMEQMITGAVCEILIGVVADPAHGFVLPCGRGRDDRNLKDSQPWFCCNVRM